MRLFFALMVCCMYSFTNAQALSNNISAGNEFEKLKGKLIWPVDHIKEIFTYEQALEDARHRTTSCAPAPSLTIKSDSPISVKAAASGQVCRIFDVEGNWTVMVKHGNHYLAYFNFTTVIVKQGDTVQTSQPLGQINIPVYQGIFELDLMLMKANKTLDPYEWFMPMELNHNNLITSEPANKNAPVPYTS